MVFTPSEKNYVISMKKTYYYKLLNQNTSKIHQKYIKNISKIYQKT